MGSITQAKEHTFLNLINRTVQQFVLCSLVLMSLSSLGMANEPTQAVRESLFQSQPIGLSLFDSTHSTNPIARLYACDDLILAALDDPIMFEALASEKPQEFEILLGEISHFAPCGTELGLICNEFTIDTFGSNLRAIADSAHGTLPLVSQLANRMRAPKNADSCDAAIFSSVSTNLVEFVITMANHSDGARTWDYASKILALTILSPRTLLDYCANHDSLLNLASNLLSGLESDVNSNLPSTVLSGRIKAARLSLGTVATDSANLRAAVWLNRALNTWMLEHAEPKAISGALQAILDSPEIDAFYHDEDSNHNEFCIAGSGLSDDVRLEWHSHSVRVADEWPVECKNLLEVEAFQLFPDSAFVILRYRTLGMYAELWLRADGSTWHVDSTWVVQL